MTLCRYCAAPLTVSLADLGATPLANSFLPPTEEAKAAERRHPLHVMVCSACRLAQTTETVPPDAIFDRDYVYLSSCSASWVAHARRYAEAMIARFGLTPDDLVAEVASNDGYLLQHFAAAGIPVLGIEPAGRVAERAEARGIATRVAFFGRATAEALAAEGRRASLIAANNVLAHVPDIRDLAAAFPMFLAPDGVATFEFPHLPNLIRHAQFDTIYHEHYSYLSLLFVERLMDDAGMRVFDAEELPTHGGSLRVFACRRDADRDEGPGLAHVRAGEERAGLDRDAAYAAFGPRIEAICRTFRAFLDRAEAEGRIVAAYGAAAKGNTFLNVAGVGADRIAFAVDRNPGKQGRLLPGSHVPVHPPDRLYAEKPGYVVILPWNLADEISREHAAIAEWGGRFVTAVPELRIR